MAITAYPHSLSVTGQAVDLNVADRYKESNLADIRADLDSRRTNMVSIFMNTTNDFNKATAIRSNNAFLGGQVYMVHKRKYDKRGTVGTHHYEHVYHADTLDEVIAHLHASD